MHRAFSFPVTLERSRTKERLEASLAGLCELELRKQRQECLVLGALALGDPPPHQRDSAGGELSCFSSWGQENLTLRRQLSALQSSPWGLMQTLEQQVGELRIDTEGGGGGGGGFCDGGAGEACDSRPSSGFYESSEGQSPKGRSCCAETSEAAAAAAAATCPWAFANDRPKSVGDPLSLNGEGEAPVLRATLPRSFSAPYPPLEGIAEEGPAADSWQWDPSGADGPWQQQQQQDHHPADDLITEEDYHEALRVESYIVSLVQRHTLSPRPCQPRTTLSPDPQYCVASGYGSSLHRRTPSLSSEQRLTDPHPQLDLSANVQARGCDLHEGEACGGEAPSLEEDCYLALPYPQCRPHSLTGRLPSPLPSLEPNCGGGPLNLCEPSSPQHYLHPQPPQLNLVSAQYIPGQACHAPVRSPRHYNPEQGKAHRAASPPDHPKSRSSKRNHNERQRSKKSGSKTRSQSENSLLAQRVPPERRYSTTERRAGRAEAPAPSQGPPPPAQDGGRRWCSNLELSQDEGEAPAEHGHRRAPRKVRRGYSCPYSQPPSHLQGQRWHPDFQERAPLCRGEDGYHAAAAAAAPAESESSMSEVYSPASSSLSSDSDESGGLVWPQQLPPRLAATSSSSSSPSPQASANPPAAQPKAFVKIKASHALKKKILRFRSGSLKVMTTV